MLVGCTGGVALGTIGSKPVGNREPLSYASQNSSPPAAAAAEAEPSASSTAKSSRPRPKDFKVTVKIIESTCYGSVGASVTYRIDPKYYGPELPEDETWTISYKIFGGNNTDTGSFKMRGDGKANIREQEFIQTPTCKPDLTAKVTQVL